MLHILRRVVQEVNDSENLTEALETIVQQVKRALEVDVCSVYLVASGDEELVLMATDGLNPQTKRQVHLKFSEGLVGLVAERAELINLTNAPDHPRYKYFPGTGEERFHAFLGIPIIHQRKLLGVLVVQQVEQRRFDDEHTAFLITLAAQLSGAISHAELSGDINALLTEIPQRDVFISGVSGSPGIAIGAVWLGFCCADLEAVPDRKTADIKREVGRFREAVMRVREEMLQLKEQIGGLLPAEERVLFDAYIMLLGSDVLVEQTIERIQQGSWAPAALRDTVRECVAVFDDMEDAYLRERGNDIRDLGRRLLLHLQKNENTKSPEFPNHTVLMGENISVSHLAEIPPENLVGVVSGHGSSSSHVALLARAMGVPAIMGASTVPFERLEGREVIVDGYKGQILIQPSQRVRDEFVRLETEEQELTAGLKALAERPALTPDGEHIRVCVNSGLIADIHSAFQFRSDGVGLYRTEFPFIVRERFPGEDEQFKIYRQVLQTVAPSPVVMRTLDVGGDKPLPYFPVVEENPFLGWRGIRITLDHPEIFLTQLRAMLRASEGLNNMRLLLPMISSIAEVDEAIGLLKQAKSELLDEGFKVVMPDVGVMIEVPAAVYLIEPLARRVDFVSVGTNDLVQYLLAVDRNNAHVAGLYRSLHPAVLQALINIVEGAHREETSVGICGEMAGDPAAVLLLMGMGIDSLSVAVGSLSRVKWVISKFTRKRTREILAAALKLEDPDSIRAELNQALADVGLGGLVRAGKA